MIKKDNNISDAEFILNNLRNEDKEELYALWGDNWYEKALENIKNAGFLILVGKDKAGNEIPVAMGGFSELFENNSEIACVWLLCAKFIYYNKQLLFKYMTEQLEAASSKYKIMYNYIYKSNFEAKKWLMNFGFQFNNPTPENMEVAENFEFFYKLRK